MTAAFDATGGTDQRFTDALSGSDGTLDPAIMMPILDVYPDALSAPMPNDLVPVIVPRVQPPAQPGVRAEPVTGPANRSGVRPPPAQRGQQQRLTPQQAGARQKQEARQREAARQQEAARHQSARSIAPARPVPQRPAVQPYRPISSPPPVAPARPTGAGFTWQGRTMTAADLSAMFRGSMPNQPAQVDRESFQATHPQSAGSGSPDAVAPAAPMASQYNRGGGQARHDARERSQERRRTTPTPDRAAAARRRSSVWAVLVFFFIIVFASGLGQKAIDLFNELFNR